MGSPFTCCLTLDVCRFEPKLAPVIGPLQKGVRGAGSLAERTGAAVQRLKQQLLGQGKDDSL